MLMAVIFAALLVGVAQAQESPLTKEQSTWVYRGTLALMAVDALQTVSMKPPVYESNVLLGTHPSKAQVAAHFALFAGLLTLVHYRWENRVLADGLTIGVGIGEAWAVGHNYSLGVRIRF